MKLSEAPRTPDAPLEELLRSALSTAGDGFDTAGLLHITQRRVTRQRRRHAAATVAATGVAAVGLVTVWQTGVPLTGSPELVQTASQPSPAADEPAQERAADPLAMTAEEGSGQEADQGTPWQAQAPPLTQEEQDLGTTEGEADPSHGAWQIPDPRPTGVAFLDELGDPRAHLTGANSVAPVDGMTANETAREGGLQQVAGQSWSYYEDGSDLASLSVYLHVTGWKDGPRAIEGLRNDELYFAWGEEQVLGTWQGRPDDPDRLLFEPQERFEYPESGEPTALGTFTASAVVRTGDYLVSVSVTADSPEEADAVAREIAEKAAENLAALDPEHGTD